MPDKPGDGAAQGRVIFAVLNEVGIIAQLSRALLESRAKDGLSMPMFGVLSHLARTGEMETPLSLARAFQQPKTTMTHTLMMLEKRKFIVMCANPNDGRSKLVQLTEQGQIALGQTFAVLSKELSGLAQQLDVAKLAEILPILMEMRKTLDANRS